MDLACFTNASRGIGKLRLVQYVSFIIFTKVSKVSFHFINVQKCVKCMQVSRHIEHNLDREEHDFSLEVGSRRLQNRFWRIG